MEPLHQIPLFRAEHIQPHLALLRKVGAPIEQLCRHSRLPVQLDSSSTYFLPLKQTHNFVHKAVRSQGIDDLELRAVQHLQITDLSNAFLGVALAQPNLYSLIQQFAVYGSAEANYVDFWINNLSDKARLLSRYTASDNQDDIRSAEWNQVMCWLSVVRAFAGKDWTPEVLGLQSNKPVGKFVHELFPNTRILVGQKSVWFDLPQSMFNLSILHIENYAAEKTVNCCKSFPSKSWFISFKQSLLPYLGDGHMNIEQAAEIAGLTRRTVQRRLAKYGYTYTKLQQLLRYEKSIDLLENTDMAILEVAYLVGWDDPAHFTRSFRKFSGLTPKDYRKQLIQQ